MNEINKEELQRLYDNHERKEVARMLEVSNATLGKLLKEAGIQLKGKGNRRPKKKITIKE